MKPAMILVFAALAALAACGGDDDGGGSDSGAVNLQATTGNAATGSGSFTVSGAAVTFSTSITDAPPGQHGIHIHETGDCGDDGMAAGGHWNPESSDHGSAGEGHLGDMGNVTVAADGTASFTFSNPDWTLGDDATTDVIGKAIILHELMDDFGQPVGNAGARIACGVVAHLAE